MYFNNPFIKFWIMLNFVINCSISERYLKRVNSVLNLRPQKTPLMWDFIVFICLLQSVRYMDYFAVCFSLLFLCSLE